MKQETLKFNYKDTFFEIHSWEMGDVSKPTILFLHGFPTSSCDYFPLAKGLQDQFHLVGFDFLGFGHSQKIDLPSLSIHLQADVAQFVTSTYQLSQPYLIAHDYGLTVAQELLAREHSFKQILLLNGGAYSHLHRPLLIQRLLQTPFLGALVSRLNSRRLFFKNMHRILSSNVPEQYLEEAWKEMCHDGGQYQFHKLIHYMADRRQHAQRWSHSLEQYQNNLHFFWGENDPISGAHMLSALRQNLPHATFKSLPAGHYPQWEAMESLEQFIKETFN